MRSSSSRTTDAASHGWERGGVAIRTRIQYAVAVAAVHVVGFMAR